MFQHHHTKTFKRYQTFCHFKFPKLPSYKTIIAKPLGKNCSENEKRTLEAKHSSIVTKVCDVLENKEIIEQILAEYPKELERTEQEAIYGREKTIDAVLNKAGLITEKDKEMYQEALSYSSDGYTIIMARAIDEL